VREPRAGKASALIPLVIDLDVLLPLFRDFILREDSFHGALRDARTAVNTLFRIDIELGLLVESGLIAARVNTVHGANIHASGVFYIETGFSDDISHISTLAGDSTAS
jgi:hypothetical protein